MLGHPLMPWQQLVADVGLEYDPATGLPYYREIWWSVSRQSGKTTLALPWQLDRCISAWPGGPQRVVYTAQTGKDARKKLFDDQVPIIQRSPLRKLITPAGGGQIRRVNGDESVTFGTGGRIELLGSTESSGHGATLNLGVIDEAWKDQDDRREQALQPAMLTIPSAQLLGFSTMGSDSSVYLNRKVEVGRESAAQDSGSGIAYFEWSIPPDEDPYDPAVWWQFLPALGWTISEQAITHLAESMSEGEFRRAIGNQRTTSSERVIPPVVWDEVQDPHAVPHGDLTYGLDVLRGIDGHDDAGSVAAHGSGRVAMLDQRPGLSWIVDRMVQLTQHRPGRVVLDGGGPAASIADDLEDAGIDVVRLQFGQVASACGRFYDLLADHKLRVRPDQGLDAAVGAVAKKQVGDRFVWSRHASTADVTPLMAATLACARLDEEVAPWVAFD